MNASRRRTIAAAIAGASDEYLECEHGTTRSQLDEEAPAEFLEDFWETNGSTACEFHTLWDLDLGPQLRGDGKIIGELHFVEGPFPGSKATYVQAEDEMTLSCLQERLNRLGQDMEIRLWEEW